MGQAPARGRSTKSRFVLWPIVECRRIKVGTARPDDRMNLRIESDLGKQSGIAERAVEFPLENGFKIDRSG